MKHLYTSKVVFIFALSTLFRNTIPSQVPSRDNKRKEETLPLGSGAVEIRASENTTAGGGYGNLSQVNGVTPKAAIEEDVYFIVNKSDMAVEERDLETVKQLYKENPAVLPSLSSLEAAAAQDYNGILEWYWSLDIRKPTIGDLVMQDQLFHATWCCIFENAKSRPKNAAKIAAREGNVKVLNWLYKQNRRYVPDQEDILYTIERSHKGALEWMARNPTYLLCRPAPIEKMIMDKHWDILEILLHSNRDISSQRLVNQAALDGRVSTLQMLFSRHKHFMPCKNTINQLYLKGSTDVIKFLQEKVPEHFGSTVRYYPISKSGDSVAEWKENGPELKKPLAEWRRKGPELKEPLAEWKGPELREPLAEKFLEHSPMGVDITRRSLETAQADSLLQAPFSGTNHSYAVLAIILEPDYFEKNPHQDIMQNTEGKTGQSTKDTTGQSTKDTTGQNIKQNDSIAPFLSQLDD